MPDGEEPDIRENTSGVRTRQFSSNMWNIILEIGNKGAEVTPPCN